MKPNNNFPSEIREGKDLVLHYSPTAHRRLKDTDDVKDIDTFGGTFNVQGMFFPHENEPDIIEFFDPGFLKNTRKGSTKAYGAADSDPLYKNPDENYFREFEASKKEVPWKRNPIYQ